MTANYDFDAIIERRGTGSSKWSRYPADVLPMWVADMDFAVAPEIIDAIRRRLDHPVLGYSVARQDLRDRIVTDMAKLYGWRIEPDSIVFLPGVEPGFNMAMRALLNPGDGIVVQTPIYRPILVAPAHWGLRRVDVELRRAADGAYYSDPALMRQALAQSRALLLCNPHNPTGKVYTRAELQEIADQCLAQDAWIISDEIHCDLLFDGRRHIPVASLDREVERRTITLMSASKTYNIAGLKTAFAIVPDKALRERFNATRLGMVDSVNAVGLEATLAALEQGEAWKQALLQYLESNRELVCDTVATRLPSVRMGKPQGTFLAWLDCSALGIDDPQAFLLDRARVGLSAGSEFGDFCGSYIRLNFGCPRGLLTQGLDRICAAFSNVQGTLA